MFPPFSFACGKTRRHRELPAELIGADKSAEVSIVGTLVAKTLITSPLYGAVTSTDSGAASDSAF